MLSWRPTKWYNITIVISLPDGQCISQSMKDSHSVITSAYFEHAGLRFIVTVSRLIYAVVPLTVTPMFSFLI